MRHLRRGERDKGSDSRGREIGYGLMGSCACVARKIVVLTRSSREGGERQVGYVVFLRSDLKQKCSSSARNTYSISGLGVGW